MQRLQCAQNFTLRLAPAKYTNGNVSVAQNSSKNLKNFISFKYFHLHREEKIVNEKNSTVLFFYARFSQIVPIS
jgi:hypothetical protein